MTSLRPAPPTPMTRACSRESRLPKWCAVIPLAFALLPCFSELCHATSWDNKPKLLLHVAPATSKNPCVPAAVLTDCTQAEATAGLSIPGNTYYNVYLLAATGSYRGSELGGSGQGIAGLQCGIAYNADPNSGVDVFAWHLCADMEFPSPDWPASCAGNLITWDATRHCQRGDVAVAGYFYLGAYSPDRLQIVPRPVDGRLLLANCAAQEIPLEWIMDAGSARFVPTPGSEGGYNPCQGGLYVDPPPGGTLGPPPCAAVPVRATSWSALKQLYRSR